MPAEREVDALGPERVGEDHAERIVAHLADEARCSACPPDGDGNVGGAAAPATQHRCRGVGRHVDRAMEVDHDVFHEVTDGPEHRRRR